MRKTVLLLLVSFCSIFSFGLTDSLSQEILCRTKAELKKHTSVSYRINYLFKYFSDKDTFQFNADCKLIRIPEDSVFKGIFWVKTSDSLEKYYNGSSIYSINNQSKTITEYQDAAKNRWALKDRHTEDLIRIFFLKPDILTEISTDTLNQIYSKDTTVSGRVYRIITILFPDELQFKHSTWRIWIRKNDAGIERITWQITFQNNCQYTEWNLYDLRYDSPACAGLSEKFTELFKSYKTEVYAEKMALATSEIQKGERAPDFSGKYYPDSTEFRLSVLKGKLVLLDFWFMSCYPCILTIPELSKLMSEYGNRGLVVIGVNNADRNAKGMAKLPGFIKINGMNYPIVFVDREVALQFHVQAYPTLYLLDKELVVIYSQRGFQGNMHETLKTVIEEALRK